MYLLGVRTDGLAYALFILCVSKCLKVYEYNDMKQNKEKVN